MQKPQSKRGYSRSRQRFKLTSAVQTLVVEVACHRHERFDRSVNVQSSWSPSWQGEIRRDCMTLTACEVRQYVCDMHACFCHTAMPNLPRQRQTIYYSYGDLDNDALCLHVCDVV